MSRQDICDELVCKVREILRNNNIQFVENRPSKKTFEDHHSFKKSKKRTYLYIQYSNKIRPDDKNNICFRFLKGYNHNGWFQESDRPDILRRWRDSMIVHWSEDQGYPGFLQDQATRTVQYALEIALSHFNDIAFTESLTCLIKMSVASVDRDIGEFEKLIE